MSVSKGIQKFRTAIVVLLVAALASCSQTSGNLGKVDTRAGKQTVQKQKTMTAAERRRLEAQRQKAGQVLGAIALVGAATLIGVSVSRGGRYYNAPRGYHGRGYRSGGSHCTFYDTPNPYSGRC